MIRSLRTGISGLKSNQTRMDVVGNNIANTNTVAFKRSRVAFSELMGQQLLGVGRTAGGTGINPSFVGLGASVGSIDQNWSQGTLENTGIATDLSLEGEGFFLARSGDQTLLTRAGNFTFNRDGEFVTASGLPVQGWAFDEEGSVITGAPTDIMVDFGEQSPAKYTENAEVGGNLSADMADGASTSISTVLYDEQGAAHNAIVEFTKTAGSADEWSYNVRYSGSESPAPFADITGGSLSFNVDGSFSAASDSTLTWDSSHVSSGADIQLDFSRLTQYSGTTTSAFRNQDGYSPGTVTGYSLNPEGVLQLNFSNGQQQKVFQLAIGNVNNPNGLMQQGENFYSVGAASGDLQLGRAGRDLRTSVVAGTLEMSNVDLATEFTDMIVAQRGYQAAARIITTSDEMLQETVGLKR